MLYIVATPIGNLGDMTFRAVEVLKAVDLIAAEDTRHTRVLTRHYGIDTPLTSYFEHNKIRKASYLLQQLQEGRHLALVTDAGTPGISDPGFHLIRLARRHNIELSVVPGATALIAALSLSGLPAHRFAFEGFLPVKSGARRRHLERLRDEDRTLIFYASPHRLLKVLKDMQEVWANPVVVCARELTKRFEEVRQAPCAEHITWFTHHPPRGEFVVLVNLSAHQLSSI